MVLEEVENILGGEKTLHFKLRNKLDLVELAEKGVSKSSLNNLIRYLAISQKQMATLLGITPRTIQNRRPRDLFKTEVSEHILQIAEVVATGNEVFKDPEKFRIWLNIPNIALGRRTPVSLLNTKYGVELVIDVLGRIAHGVYS